MTSDELRLGGAAVDVLPEFTEAGGRPGAGRREQITWRVALDYAAGPWQAGRALWKVSTLAR
jgi:hypothetical protein